jgi:hypothetical protein
MSRNRIGFFFSADDFGRASPQPAAMSCATARPRIRPGDRVRVRRGVLTGVEGRVVRLCAASRVLVSIDLDCQGVSLEIEGRMLEVLDP